MKIFISTGRIISGILFDDFPRKLIALFFAVLVYLTVSYKTGEEGIIQNVPVKVNLPASLGNMEEFAPKVTLSIRASQRTLRRVSAADFSIEPEILNSKYVSGELYHIKLDPAEVKSPIGVTVTKVTPEELLVTLDQNLSRKVEVLQRFRNESGLPKGYAVKNAAITPSEVVVTGPGKIIEGIKNVHTMPIDLKDTFDSFDFMAQVDSPSDIIKINPSRVMTKIEIIREEEERIIRGIPLKIMTSTKGDNYFDAELLSSANVDVTVSGPKDKVEQISLNQLKPYVEVSAFEKPGIYNADISCFCSMEGVKIKNIFPRQVQLKIIIVKIPKKN